MNIKQWATDDRPRERMILHGATALSNAELLAILIGSGSTDESAVELMRKILGDYRNSLNELGKLSINELCRYKGIGQAKAVTILAAAELGKRRAREIEVDRNQIRCSTDIYRIFHPIMCDLSVEECWVLLLNQSAKVIDRVCISRGGLASTQVDIRCVLREALVKRAISIVLCHNHPSGNISPSLDDDRLTQSLRRAVEAVNIRLLDHLIVSGSGYYSYADEGRIIIY